jgi:DNA-binding CsgD family transcriptional regulator
VLSNRLVCLTLVEAIIIKMIANGKATKEIADVIDRSLPTIEEHINRSRAKLGAKSRPHLVSMAWCCGVITRTDIECVNAEVIVNGVPKALPR